MKLSTPSKKKAPRPGPSLHSLACAPHMVSPIEPCGVCYPPSTPVTLPSAPVMAPEEGRQSNDDDHSNHGEYDAVLSHRLTPPSQSIASRFWMETKICSM